ncbi:MAG: nucleotidyl transferase AbiEii/AbiGii toxin family protein [Candidatus Methanoperedens sp.]|nr:nucleotidyl transferase AbiEii/AbiGii toxin family protein [Candidatus Methanoperedens sp.]MCE8429455.1 nucleotidyl transferase AbiEii/AbiGii toxin family protein [Candidatus Methanoperedens sp.]
MNNKTILIVAAIIVVLGALRSIIQRGKSRDYFDVWMLLNKNKFDKDKIKELFIEKCKFKNIKPDYELFFKDTKLNEARDFWEKGLARLMKEVPVFDTIIADLRKELESLQMSRILNPAMQRSGNHNLFLMHYESNDHI